MSVTEDEALTKLRASGLRERERRTILRDLERGDVTPSEIVAALDGKIDVSNGLFQAFLVAPDHSQLSFFFFSMQGRTRARMKMKKNLMKMMSTKSNECKSPIFELNVESNQSIQKIKLEFHIVRVSIDFANASSEFELWRTRAADDGLAIVLDDGH